MTALSPNARRNEKRRQEQEARGATLDAEEERRRERKGQDFSYQLLTAETQAEREETLMWMAERLDELSWLV